MYQEEFNKIVSNPANISEIDMVDLRSMSERYPYCQIAHLFYAKKLRDMNNAQFENQLKKASISVYDRTVLHDFIENTAFNKPILADFQESPETLYIEKKTATPEEKLIEEIPVLDNIPVETEMKEHVIEETTEIENILIDSDFKEPVIEETSEIENIPIESDYKELVIEETSEIENIPIESDYKELVIEETSEIENIPKENEHQEPVIEEITVNNAFEVPQIQEEQVQEEVIEEVQQEMPELKTEEAVEQEHTAILEDYVENTPELVIEEVIPSTEETEVLAEQYEEEKIEELEEVTQQLATPEIDPLHIQMDAMLEMEDIEEAEETWEDELLFDAPPYDIESELGPLPDDQKINITIQRPVPEQEIHQIEQEIYSDSFVGWLNRLSGDNKGQLVEQKASNKPIVLSKRKPDPETAHKGAEKVINEIVAGQLAKKSIQADEHLITETYARILVMQAKYSKAVEMYSKLSLLKPQKSDYFAALIDQLKKRIK